MDLIRSNILPDTIVPIRGVVLLPFSMRYPPLTVPLKSPELGSIFPLNRFTVIPSLVSAMISLIESFPGFT